jgi:hypothetical protein
MNAWIMLDASVDGRHILIIPVAILYAAALRAYLACVRPMPLTYLWQPSVGVQYYHLE